MYSLSFSRPPLFIPRGRLVSIASGRGATASTTGTSARYFDIIVKVQEKDVPENEYTEEFTGIAREELQVLNQYIQRILIPAMKRDAGETTNEASQADDDDEDEEDQPPTRHTPGKRTPRRKASVEAQRISRSQMENGEDDEDDDDEDDYKGNKGGGGDAEEDDDDDDDDEEDDEDFEEAMVDRGDNDAEDDEDEDDDEDDDDDWAGGKSPSKKRRIS